jgi:tetratricopeptide (TPR) repeat protein
MTPTQAPDEKALEAPESSPGSKPAEIQVFLAGVIFGPYTEQKVRSRLDEGLLTLDDEARLAETEPWLPLRQVLEQIPPAAPPSPPAPVSVPMSRFSPPAGAAKTTAPIKRTAPILSVSSPFAAPVTIPVQDPLPVVVTRPPSGGLPSKRTGPVPLPPAPIPASTLPPSSDNRPAAPTRPATTPLSPPPRRTVPVSKPTASTRSLPSIPPLPSSVRTRPLTGIRSQIQARTTKEPSNLATPELAAPPAKTDEPISFLATTGIPLPFPPETPPAPEPAPASELPPDEPAAAQPLSPPEAPTITAPPEPAPRPLDFSSSSFSTPPLARTAPLESPPVSEPAPEPETAPPTSSVFPRTPSVRGPETSVPDKRPPSQKLAVSSPTEFAPLPLGSEAKEEKEPVPPVRAPLRAKEPLAPPTGNSGTPKQTTRLISVADLATAPKESAAPAPTVPPLKKTITAPIGNPVFGIVLPARKPASTTTTSPVRSKTLDHETPAAAQNPASFAPLPGAKPPAPPLQSAETRTGPMLPPGPSKLGRPLAQPGEGLKKAPLTRSAPNSVVVPPGPTAGTGPVTLASLAAAPAPTKATAPVTVPPGPSPNEAALAKTISLPPIGARSFPPVSTPETPLSSEPAEAEEEAPPAPASDPADYANRPGSSTRRTLIKKARARRRKRIIMYGLIGLAVLILLGLALILLTSYVPRLHSFISNHFGSGGSNPSTEPAFTPPETPAPAPASTPPASLTPAPQPTPSAPATQLTPGQPSPATPPATANAPAGPTTPPPPLGPQVTQLLADGTAKQTKGDLDGAIEDFSQAIALDPSATQAFSDRASARNAKGDFDGAIADDTQVIAQQPHNAAAFCQRGFIKQSKNDLDGAIADYTLALQLDPKNYIALYNRGLIKEQKGDPDGALVDYNQALDLSPKFAGAYYNRGNAKSDKSDFDGAIADYTRALEINPKISMAYCNRGLAEQNTGNLDAAFQDYNQALALDPKIAIALYNRGLIKEQKNDLDGSIADSSAAIQLNPKNAQAYYNRGVALQAKGDLDGAAKDLRAFGVAAPKDPYADYASLYLWLISTQQQKKSMADQELTTDLENSWNSEPGQLASKIAGYLLDRVPESDLMAAASSPDAKRDQGQHCEIWYFIGMKKLFSGDKPGAISCFQKCVSTGQKDYCEYILSQAELQSLGET